MRDRTEYFKQWREQNRARRTEYQRAFRAKQNGVKLCPDCGEELPVSEFYTNAARKCGYSTYCKKHQLERDQKRRENDREGFNAYHQEYQAKVRSRKDDSMETQTSLFTPAPATGPRCRVCGKALRSYDVARGECFRHPVARVRDAREGRIQLTAQKGA